LFLKYFYIYSSRVYLFRVVSLMFATFMGNKQHILNFITVKFFYIITTTTLVFYLL